MASVVKDIVLPAPIDQVWDAIADVGAIHTRLAPGFVTDTRYADGVRTVTFANGMTVEEPIVSIDRQARRLVWTAKGARTSHYNASLQALVDDAGTRIIWIADFLPDSAVPIIEMAMKSAVAAITAHFTRSAQGQS